MVLQPEAGIVAMPAMRASLAWEWKRSMQAISAARPLRAADVGGLDTFRWAAAQLFPRLAFIVALSVIASIAGTLSPSAHSTICEGTRLLGSRNR
jgi:hypothetical protein